MYAFAVLGGDAESALDRLLPELDGRTAEVRVDGAAADGGTATLRADTEFVLDDGWRATGSDRSLADALDRLAPDHEYAAVLGAADTGLPAIVVGDPGRGEAVSDGAPGTETDDAPGIETNDAPEAQTGSGGAEGTTVAGRPFVGGSSASGGPLVAADDATVLDVEAAVSAIRETEPHETLESLVAAVKSSPEAEYSGAIATFTGRVRAKEDPDDERTRFLEFETYDDVAESRMRAIEADLEARDGVLDVRLHHRTGRIPDGEDIVFVVVLAGHRREAFRTVEDGIDRLKEEVPIFKKEVTDAERFWVHERDA